MIAQTLRCSGTSAPSPERARGVTCDYYTRAMSAVDLDGGQPNIVQARDVCRRYGAGEAAVDALMDVSVGFPSGRFAAIMGPSGSGKSTLMHILAGLDRPTSGSVELDGVELTDLDDRKLTQLRRDRIGFIFQTFNLLPVLSAEENILLPLSIAGRKPDREWLDRLIDTIGIRDRLQSPSGRDVRRPAATRGGRARARLASGRGVRRRAHGQPRLEGLGRCARTAAPCRRRLLARRSSWSPTTPTRRRLPTVCWCWSMGASTTTGRRPAPSRRWT